MTRAPWLLALLAACGTARADDPRERFEKDMMVRFHMHENLGLLRAVEKLIIHGRLEEAKALASAISEAPDEPGLGPLAPHAVRVRELAAALARSPTLEEAANREARLGVACAGCHVETGVTVSPKMPPVPPDRPTIEARMNRHLWATDRLWEAVIGGGDDPWIQGLEVLAASPLPFASQTDERRRLAQRLQRLATGAKKRVGNDRLEERGRTYGELIGVCATCHGTPPPTSLPSDR